MRNPRAKESFTTLAARLREIRRRPINEEQIEKLNRIFEQIEIDQKKSKAADELWKSEGFTEGDI